MTLRRQGAMGEGEARARCTMTLRGQAAMGVGEARARCTMTLRGQAALGECEARTQGAGVAELRTRPRTPHRTAQCGRGRQGFVVKRAPRMQGALGAALRA